jgi:tetratricopeptide (TPR) repeat protein
MEQSPQQRLPADYQIRIVTNEFSKDELLELMRAYELTATELNLVGNAFRQLDEHDHAEHAFRQSIASAPNYDEAYGNLLSLYTLQERYDDGRALAADALAHAEKHGFIWFHYGRMCALAGDLDNAIDAAYAALNAEDYEFEAAYELGVRALLERIGSKRSKDPESDVQDAWKLLTVGLQKFPDSAALQELAEVFEDD